MVAQYIKIYTFFFLFVCLAFALSKIYPFWPYTYQLLLSVLAYSLGCCRYSMYTYYFDFYSYRPITIALFCLRLVRTLSLFLFLPSFVFRRLCSCLLLPAYDISYTIWKHTLLTHRRRYRSQFVVSRTSNHLCTVWRDRRISLCWFFCAFVCYAYRFLWPRHRIRDQPFKRRVRVWCMVYVLCVIFFLFLSSHWCAPSA